MIAMMLKRLGFRFWTCFLEISLICWVWVACTQKVPLDPTESLVDETVVSTYFDLITANPLKIKVGGSEATIRAHLVNNTGTALSNRTVQFTSTLGTTLAPTETKTDTSGWATTVLKSGSTVGTTQVTASYEKTTKSIGVQIVSATDTSVTDMKIYTEKTELLANGIENTTIAAELVSGSGQSLAGGTVVFTSTAGTILLSPVTVEASNRAVTWLTGTASVNDVNAVVTASYRDVSKTVGVLFKGIQFSVEANPLTILADGKSASTIRVRIKETTSQTGIVGAEIYIGRTLGDIVGSIKTDNRGVAEAELTGTKAGISKVRIWYGKTFRDSVYVQLLESAPVYLDVTATPSVLPADGFSQSIIKAIVTDFNRNPVPDGTIVQFDIIDGSGSIIRQKTTINGVAESAFTASTKPDTALIAVHVGTLADTLTIYCKVGDPDNVLISSDVTKLPADGITNARIQARVLDSQGNPIQGATVRFAATIGDITPSAPTDAQGIARAQYSSGVIGNATLSASVQKASGMLVTGTIQIQLLPGKPQSIPLRFNPNEIGVKDTGKNQTVEVIADVKDAKGNAVEDGTWIKFSIYDAPGVSDVERPVLSSTNPIPTVGGTAKVSLSSGIRSGTVRIQAEVVNAQGNPLVPSVKGISTPLIIDAGPPYIEDVNTDGTLKDLKSKTHLTVAAVHLNIWSTLDTTQVSIAVSDKYRNPVEENTAVYLTTSGGLITTHTAYTGKDGKASVTLTGANPQPNIDMFYGVNVEGMKDPNLGTTLPGYVYYPDLDQYLLPNFEVPPSTYGSDDYGSYGDYPGILGGYIQNSRKNYLENDGIARIMASTMGVDGSGKPARPWHWTSVVMSGLCGYDDNSDVALQGKTLYIGESETVLFSLMDDNGNPIECNTSIKAEVRPSDAQAGLSWADITTGDGQGRSYYYITIFNNVDPKNKKKSAAAIKISWTGKHQYGSAITHSVVIDTTGAP